MVASGGPEIRVLPVVGCIACRERNPAATASSLARRQVLLGWPALGADGGSGAVTVTSSAAVRRGCQAATRGMEQLCRLWLPRDRCSDCSNRGDRLVRIKSFAHVWPSVYLTRDRYGIGCFLSG